MVSRRCHGYWGLEVPASGSDSGCGSWDGVGWDVQPGQGFAGSSCLGGSATSDTSAFHGAKM